MRVLRVTLGTLGWVLLVAGVIAGAWFAVDRAGGEVGTSGRPPDVIALPQPSPPSSPSPSAPSPTSSRSPGASPSPSASPGSSPGYPTEAGRLGARCQGTRLTYWSVHPAAGRTVAANQISDQTVQFTFDHDGSPVVISATCRASGLSFQRVAASPSPSPSR